MREQEKGQLHESLISLCASHPLLCHAPPVTHARMPTEQPWVLEKGVLFWSHSWNEPFLCILFQLHNTQAGRDRCLH